MAPLQAIKQHERGVVVITNPPKALDAVSRNLPNQRTRENVQRCWVSHLLGQGSLTMHHGRQIQSLKLLWRQGHRRRHRRQAIRRLLVGSSSSGLAVVLNVTAHIAGVSENKKKVVQYDNRNLTARGKAYTTRPARPLYTQDIPKTPYTKRELDHPVS